MKNSIRFRLTFVLMALVIGSIFSCWFMNRTLLPSYYQKTKVATLGNAYAEANHIYNTLDGEEDKTSDDILLEFEKLGANKDLNFYVMDIWKVGISYPNYVCEFYYPQNPSKMQQDLVVSRIKEYLTDESNLKQGVIISKKGKQIQLDKGKELLESSNQYNIYKVFDERIQSNYIELFGILDNGMYAYIRANYESMQDSVKIFNTFLAYVGILVTCIGVIIMFYVSKSFTRPIQELSGIAKHMSKLEFGVKYNVTSEDEIGDLGHSINILSETLEKTIMELKSANNELKTDIEQKIQIDEMRKEFLSNVSHELKTPIALIQGYAEGLKDNISEDPEDKDFYCEVIMDEASKMNKMVKKLLSLNQIEFGNNQIQFERFDIVALIRSVLNSTDILFQQKEVTLCFEEENPIFVWADEYMVEEVVTNYISNALNHVEGEKKIEVKLIQLEDVVRISVFNTGERIPEEELDKVWIKFYKVDKARTREYGGSGIGLSIVKAIMNSLNQAFGVRNREDGVEFWFELDSKSDCNCCEDVIEMKQS